MKSGAQRKLTRFYIINPISDRRVEQRFDAREDVVVKLTESGKIMPAVAIDVGRTGMRLELDASLPVGADVEVAFPRAVDHVQCFGRVAWSKSLGSVQLAGIAVDSWHGVVLGEESWTRYKGVAPKKDRRGRPR